MSNQKVSKPFDKKRKQKKRFGKKFLFVDDEVEDIIMSRLEEEFERTLREKIIQCKRNNGNLDVVLFEEYNRGSLRNGLVSNAEKAAGYSAAAIKKYLKNRYAKDKLSLIERYNIFVAKNFHEIVSKVEAGGKIENSAFFGKYWVKRN